jgi:DNA polymerase I-like protein with 3'-5' exonuclease and polymerase domains
MRKRFVYDIESDGFVTTMTRVHCLVLWDLDTQELLSFRNDGNPDNAKALEDAVRMLDAAELRIGHNIIKFDEPAIAKIYPFFRPNREGVVFDTLIATRLIWPNIADSDKGRVARRTLDGCSIGSHSLDAWGQRLGSWKGDYSKAREAALKAHHAAAGMEPPTKDEIATYVWGRWNQEMQDYCDQDVVVNARLYGHIRQKNYAQRAFDDEMAMAILCQKIEANGYPFDEEGAQNLYITLGQERAVLADKLRDFFGLWVEKAGDVKTPTVSNGSIGYWGETRWVYLDDETELAPEDFTKGGLPNAAAKNRGVRRVFDGYPFTPIKIIEFNPTSRFHIANRLKALCGWEPEAFTPEGEPKVDEEVLQGLTFEAAPLLIAYFTVAKRVGQLAEGKQAWLKLVREGRIHGSYNTVGAVTRRATHSNPNIGQVPGVQSLYGKECRQLFGVPKGWWQVGTDASGLELRCLAHFMARWDAGAYAKVLLEGDIHTENQKAAGLPTRNDAKTFVYAFLYGAGDAKIGSIVKGGAADGKRLKAQFMESLPALGELAKAVKTKAKHHKTLNALDGGVLQVRHDHAALNTLLQSAGALICKRWLVTLEKELLRRGYKHGWDGDVVFLAWVHDEAQIACRTKELAEEVGELSRWAMKETEAYYGFRCPLDVDFKIGHNWYDCH